MVVLEKRVEGDTEMDADVVAVVEDELDAVAVGVAETVRVGNEVNVRVNADVRDGDPLPVAEGDEDDERVGRAVELAELSVELVRDASEERLAVELPVLEASGDAVNGPERVVLTLLVAVVDTVT